MASTKGRSLLKALTYRATGTIWMFCIAYAVTGSTGIGGLIAGLEFIVKIIFYFIHERIWKKIKWGKI